MLVNKFMKIELNSIFCLGLRVFNSDMATFSKTIINNKPQFSARFNPLSLRDVRKTVARHKRAV